MVNIIEASNTENESSNSARFIMNEENNNSTHVSKHGSSSGSSFQKDAMCSLEKLFGSDNKYLMEKTFQGCNNVSSMIFKIGISNKIPKCYLRVNASALLPENFSTLILIINGTSIPLNLKNMGHFNIACLADTDTPGTIGSFRNARHVYHVFLLYLDILGFVYEDPILFQRIFKNVLSVFKNTTQLIFNINESKLVMIFSELLVKFTLILRNPDLDGCSQEALICTCQEQLKIEENKVLLEALADKPLFIRKPLQQKQNTASSTNNFQNNKQKPINNNNVIVKRDKPLCIKQLGLDLKLNNDECTFKNKCRFDHVKIPNVCSADWKKGMKDRIQATNHIKDKQSFSNAIDGL